MNKSSRVVGPSEVRDRVAPMRTRLPRIWPDIADWPVLIASVAGVPLFVRRWILDERGHRLAADVRIHAGTIVHGSRLTIGRDTFINRDCVIQADAPVMIGERSTSGQASGSQRSPTKSARPTAAPDTTTSR